MIRRHRIAGVTALLLTACATAGPAPTPTPLTVAETPEVEEVTWVRQTADLVSLAAPDGWTFRKLVDAPGSAQYRLEDDAGAVRVYLEVSAATAPLDAQSLGWKVTDFLEFVERGVGEASELEDAVPYGIRGVGYQLPRDPAGPWADATYVGCNVIGYTVVLGVNHLREGDHEVTVGQIFSTLTVAGSPLPRLGD